jgi:hypothetical protein
MVDCTESRNVRLLGHPDLNGEGDAIQMMIKGNVLYVGRTPCGRPMLMLDVADSGQPHIIGELPCYPEM